MKQLVPSTQALQAFEASARHCSFTRAAAELCVTQGAVSRHVALLEDFLGVPLFERVRQRVVLTDAGRAYLARVQPALRELAGATTELLIHRGAGGVLRIASLPTFNAKWLVPRLPRFSAQHPQVTLEFLPFVPVYEFMRPELDCAIRYGEGVWPGTVADYVEGREFVAVCSATAAAKSANVDINKLPLLHHSSVPNAWPEWFASAQVETANAQVGPRFDQYSVLIQAAAAGLGAALVPLCLAEEELASRRLRLAHPHRYAATQGYYLCYPEAKRQWPPLVAFRDWILTESVLAAQRAVPAARARLKKRVR